MAGFTGAIYTIADAFAGREVKNWRYAPELGRWLRWNGSFWEIDRSAGPVEVVRRLCREHAKGRGDGVGRRLGRERTIAAIVRLASADPRLTIFTDQMDRDPMLLNTRRGVVDLVTGQVRKPDRDEFHTRVAGAVPGVGRPIWLRFLDQVTGGDPDYIAYIKRICGYCLTGLTEAQVFFFVHGEGANGKSVFLTILEHVLGTYARTAAFATFAVTRNERHTTEIAALRGARLVTVHETEGGRKWREARIKELTGGDRTTARFMSKDDFQFSPICKIVLAGNHGPAIETVGTAMRRRLHLLPFSITIPPEARDPKLIEKLKAEADGILGWMIEGCREWIQVGLEPPAVVREAAEDYFSDEDHIGDWIAEACDTDPGGWSSSSGLFQSWSAWSQAAGLDPREARWFGEQLRARGFKQRKRGGVRGWSGISLRREDPIS